MELLELLGELQLSGESESLLALLKAQLGAAGYLKIVPSLKIFYGEVGFTSLEPHRQFFGRMIDTMPLLINGTDKKGKKVDIPRTPVSFTYVLERQQTAPDDNVRGEWLNHYIFTGDLVATGVDGDILSVWDSPLLRSLTSESKLNNGALILSTTQWNELKAQKEGTLYLTAEQAAQVHQQGFVKQEGIWTPSNKEVARVWDHLGRGQDLTSYATIVGGATRSKNIMNVYLDASARQLPTGRAWVVVRGAGCSSADGDYKLDSNVGRIVGVAPALREKMLEARVHESL